MIRYEIPSTGNLLRYDFDLPQAGFTAAGNFVIPVSGAVFMMLIYRVGGFNNTWNTNDPLIQFVSDNVVFNRIVLDYVGGTSYSDPVFTKYPDTNIDASISPNSATVQWTGDAGLLTGAEFMNFSLFYVLKIF